MAETKLRRNPVAQEVMIECLALGKGAPEIMELIKQEFDIKISESNVSWYRVHRRADVMAKRMELEKEILSKFRYALASQRLEYLHERLKESEKIGKIDIEQAAGLISTIDEGKYRKDAIVGIYNTISDGTDQRIARQQSLLKQIADEVKPLKLKDPGDDDEETKDERLTRLRQACRNAPASELAAIEAQIEGFIKEGKPSGVAKSKKK